MALRSDHQATSRVIAGTPVTMDLVKMGEAQTEAMLALQKELADTCEKISRSWVARAKSEADLWSELATKVSAARSPPDALEAYQQSMTQRMQMAMDDGRQLVDGGQRIMGVITRAMSSGWPTGSA